MGWRFLRRKCLRWYCLGWKWHDDSVWDDVWWCLDDIRIYRDPLDGSGMMSGTAMSEMMMSMMKMRWWQCLRWCNDAWWCLDDIRIYWDPVGSNKEKSLNIYARERTSSTMIWCLIKTQMACHKTFKVLNTLQIIWITQFYTLWRRLGSALFSSNYLAKLFNMKVINEVVIFYLTRA